MRSYWYQACCAGLHLFTISEAFQALESNLTFDSSSGSTDMKVELDQSEELRIRTRTSKGDRLEARLFGPDEGIWTCCRPGRRHLQKKVVSLFVALLQLEWELTIFCPGLGRRRLAAATLLATHISPLPVSARCPRSIALPRVYPLDASRSALTSMPDRAFQEGCESKHTVSGSHYVQPSGKADGARTRSALHF